MFRRSRDVHLPSHAPSTLHTHECRAVLGRNASDGETANPRSSLSTPALIGAQEPTEYRFLDRQAVPTQHKKTLISRCPLYLRKRTLRSIRSPRRRLREG